MSWNECAPERLTVCDQTAKDTYSQCTEERKEGYNQCTQTRDEGYKDCCDWWPCSWACDAWAWISNIVCIWWTWVSYVVCVAWTWITNIVCVLWTVLTIPVCLLVPNSFTKWADHVVSGMLAAGGGIVSGVIWAVGHPIDAVQAVIGLFGGCPGVRANQHEPFLIIAHHGYPVLLAENTIQSGQYAITRRKADSLEIDLCMTSDGDIIVWHDWDPDSTTSLLRQEGGQPHTAWKPQVPAVGSPRRRPVVELSLAEFRSSYSYLFQGDPTDLVKLKIEVGAIDTRIPTLGEYIGAASGWRGLRLLCLDVKMPAEAVDRAGEMIDKIHESVVGEHGFDIVVMVPDELVLAAMKQRSEEQGYDFKFSWDVEFPVGLILDPERYSAVDHAVTQLHNRAASVGRPVTPLLGWPTYRETIAYDIKRWNEVNADPKKFNAGQKIDYLIAWTIDDADEMQCLETMGVSGIITNYPDVLASQVGR